MQHSRKHNKGFTLIELLVVISIIAVLSSVVMAAVTSAREKAMKQRAISDMQTFGKILSFAQGESGKTLGEISLDGGATIYWCSACLATCSPPNQLNNIPETNSCYKEWGGILKGVKMYSGDMGNNLDNMLRDPWGSPYLVDQNQGEGTTTTKCERRDTITSAGPDGLRGTSDDVYLPSGLHLSASCN